MNLFSFIFPITIYKSKTALGTLIEVRELFGHKKLNLDGYPQSGSTYKKYWKSIFLKAKIAALPDDGKALVLGLGGGDLAKILEKTKPKWKTIFVELEREIVDVARNYFGIEATPGRSLIIADARSYMVQNKNKFDVVIIDLYSGDLVPDFVTSPNFLKQVGFAIKPDGVAIFNYASHSFREENFAEFTLKLSKIFTDVQQFKYIGHPFFLVKFD